MDINVGGKMYYLYDNHRTATTALITKKLYT